MVQHDVMCQPIVSCEVAFCLRSRCLGRDQSDSRSGDESSHHLLWHARKKFGDFPPHGRGIVGRLALLRFLTRFRDLANMQTTISANHAKQRESGDRWIPYPFHNVLQSAVWESDSYNQQWTIKVVCPVVPHIMLGLPSTRAGAARVVAQSNEASPWSFGMLLRPFESPAAQIEQWIPQRTLVFRSERSHENWRNDEDKGGKRKRDLCKRPRFASEIGNRTGRSIILAMKLLFRDV
jgi:hypothetical protein